MSLEERFEAMMKNYELILTSNEKLKNQNEHFRCQLGEKTKLKQKGLASVSGSDQDIASNKGRNFLESYHRKEPPRRPRREKRQPDLNDHEVNVPKFEGKLNPDEFLKWL